MPGGREREATLAELTRQLQLRSDRDQTQGSNLAAAVRVAPFDLATVQRALGTDTALVEYFSLDGELMAFIVSAAGVTVVPKLCAEARVETLIEQLRFQINTLRYGARRLHSHLPQLASGRDITWLNCTICSSPQSRRTSARDGWSSCRTAPCITRRCTLCSTSHAGNM